MVKRLLIFIGTLWWCLFPDLLHALEPIGSVTALKGQALDRRQEAIEWLTLRLTDPLLLNDMVQTKEASKVEFLMKDDSLLSLGENTQLLINEHIYLPEKDRRSSVFRLVSGKVRAIVGKTFSGEGSRFQVETPTAVISTRGTDFLAWVVNPQLTIVIVLSGEVWVKNILAEVGGEQLLRENYMTEISLGKHPIPPVLALPEQKEPLLQDTHVGKQLTETPPAEKALGEEVTAKGEKILTSPTEHAPAAIQDITSSVGTKDKPSALPPIPQQPTDNPKIGPFKSVLPLPPPPP